MEASARQLLETAIEQIQAEKQSRVCTLELLTLKSVALKHRS